MTPAGPARATRRGRATRVARVAPGAGVLAVALVAVTWAGSSAATGHEQHATARAATGTTTGSTTAGHAGHDPATATGGTDPTGTTTVDGSTTTATGTVHHDHGKLSVGVLVTDDHVMVSSALVQPGQYVTALNQTTTARTLTATDGSFTVTLPAGAFLTFPAPTTPGGHPFTDPDTPDDPATGGVLTVG